MEFRVGVGVGERRGRFRGQESGVGLANQPDVIILRNFIINMSLCATPKYAILFDLKGRIVSKNEMFG